MANNSIKNPITRITEEITYKITPKTPIITTTIPNGIKGLRKSPFPPIVDTIKSTVCEEYYQLNGFIGLYIPVSSVQNGSFTYQIFENKINVRLQNQLDIYVVYNTNNLTIPTSTVKYYFIPIEFTIGKVLSTVDCIKAFAWDEDPRGSRGTETTVQNPAPAE